MHAVCKRCKKSWGMEEKRVCSKSSVFFLKLPSARHKSGYEQTKQYQQAMRVSDRILCVVGKPLFAPA